MVTSGTFARDAVAKLVEDEEEDHEFYLSTIRQIFKLYKRSAPVEVDEDGVFLPLVEAAGNGTSSSL